MSFAIHRLRCEQDLAQALSLLETTGAALHRAQVAHDADPTKERAWSLALRKHAKAVRLVEVAEQALRECM